MPNKNIRMNGFKQECKLCGNIMNDENLEVIEEVVKNIFDNLSLKLTLNNKTQNVMCTMCSSKLLAALNFKSTCLSTENSIIPYIDFENKGPVNLKEIYAKEKGSKQGSRMLDDWEICRLCLQPMGNDHKSVQEVPVDCIEIYIPEINFAVSTNPIICLKCHDALCAHSSFIKNSLDVDKKRNGDAVDGGDIHLNDQSFKTEEIEIKTEKTDENILFATLCDINKEEREEGDTPLQSQIILTHTEEIKSLYDLDDGEQTTNASYQTEQCCFKITPGSLRNCWDIEEKRNMNATNVGDMLLAIPCIKMEETEIKDENKGNEEGDTSLHSQSGMMDTEEIKIQYDLEDINAESTIVSYKNKECTSISRCESNRKMRHQYTHKNEVKLTRTYFKVQMYQCDKCMFKTRHRTSYTRHQLLHKDPLEVRTYQCDECAYKTIRKNDLEKHQLRHKDPSEVRLFKCGECDYESLYSGCLKLHQLEHKDPSQVQMHTCDKCKFISKYKDRHKDLPEVRMFQCDECDYRTVVKSNLKKHQLRHRDPSEVQMFKCDQCDYQTIEKGSLRTHQLRHKDPSEVQMFKCDECSYKTIQKRLLRSHQLRHKDLSEVQKFKCDQCDYKSIYKGNLRTHLLTHKDPSEVRVFKCDECDYKTIQKGNLLNHQLAHKDPLKVQMFKCDKCDYRSIYSKSLRNHLLRHKDPSEVQMFKCDQCDHKTARKGDLKQHQLKHKTPSEVLVFKCDECDYKSIYKSYMNKHHLRHKVPSGVQMFKCYQCNYITIRKENLRAHLLTHKDPSERQMFECDECDYKNFRKGYLKRHQLKHKDPSEVR